MMEDENTPEESGMAESEEKYYYTDKAMDCEGWAVVLGEGGTTLSCHKTKREAVQALVAKCAEDGCEPGGYWEGEIETEGEDKPKVEIKIF